MNKQFFKSYHLNGEMLGFHNDLKIMTASLGTLVDFHVNLSAFFCPQHKQVSKRGGNCDSISCAK